MNRGILRRTDSVEIFLHREAIIRLVSTVFTELTTECADTDIELSA